MYKYDLETDADNLDNSLNIDEEWMHDTGFNNLNGENHISSRLSILREHELTVAKAIRLKEIEIKSILREILIYSSFLWILYIVAYTNSAKSTYSYQTSLKKQFVDPGIRLEECKADSSKCIKPNLSKVN
jgi:hypothetical protein